MIEPSKIIQQKLDDTNDIKPFLLENFNSNSSSTQITNSNKENELYEKQVFNTEAMDKILNRLDILSSEISTIKQNENVQSSKKLDSQIIEALTSLNNHSKQFEKMTRAFEDKLISYSLKIASKIIAQEVESNSKQIALNYSKNLLEKLKDATTISIHVNPIDYEYLHSNLDLSETTQLIKDSNVQQAGIVISSDIGNFDSTVEAKLESLSQSIETLYKI
jgi:flagellar assembly protein FliH